MKRRALLIGYTGADSNEDTLEGVLFDLEKYKNYLMSSRGGAWENDEIIVLNAPTKSKLKIQLLLAKADGIDMMFTVFSGHGDFDDVEKGCRRFLLNKDEIVWEKELWNIAKKQILICDSCAGLRSRNANESLLEEKRVSNIIKTSSNERLLARKKYDTWCYECENQLIRLYAAKAGTYAEDQDGGVYTNCLIDVLEHSEKSISIMAAHDRAKPIVELRTNGQKPTKQCLKVMKFLPGAIVI